MESSVIIDHVAALVDRTIRKDGIKTVEFLVGHNHVSPEYYVLLCWDLQCYPSSHDQSQLRQLRQTVSSYFGCNICTGFVDRTDFNDCKTHFDMLTIGLYQ